MTSLSSEYHFASGGIARFTDGVLRLSDDGRPLGQHVEVTIEQSFLTWLIANYEAQTRTKGEAVRIAHQWAEVSDRRSAAFRLDAIEARLDKLDPPAGPVETRGFSGGDFTEIGGTVTVDEKRSRTSRRWK